MEGLGLCVVYASDLVIEILTLQHIEEALSVLVQLHLDSYPILSVQAHLYQLPAY